MLQAPDASLLISFEVLLQELSVYVKQHHVRRPTDV
jgi:hypothetical protein